MSIQIPIADFSPEQRELWDHVTNLWAMSQKRDADLIRATLHPQYVGWDMNALLPHNREDAVDSVTGNTPQLCDYNLQPLSVQIYSGQVGVVHYSYTARIEPTGGHTVYVNGKWCEVYIRQNDTWVMISVSGKPEVQTK